MQVLPDSSCSVIVLKMLVKAGALLEGIGLVHQLTVKGVSLTATAAAEIMTAVEVHIAAADPRAFQLLQARFDFDLNLTINPCISPGGTKIGRHCK